MPEWFDSLRKHFSDWHVYTTTRINDNEYLRDRDWQDLISGIRIHFNNHLHLSVSMRSFRSERVAEFVHLLLDNKTVEAKQLLSELQDKYPICVTRDLDVAKKWVRSKARGNERYGLFASSKAARLKPRGVFYVRDKKSISPENWFLNGQDDIQSSYFLEAVASEFETQGLELDFAIVAWDADLRIGYCQVFFAKLYRKKSHLAFITPRIRGVMKVRADQAVKLSVSSKYFMLR